jgi:mono/diheme cytochrome c family protein
VRKLITGAFFGAICALATIPAIASDLTSADQALIKQGEYLARVGDCVACHTASGGKPFAGGLAMATPIGKIYSTNITPDPETGIGRDTFEDFDRAVRSGESRHGYSLYPAMPYPSYSRLSDHDVRALYAYFMNGVEPIHQADKPTEIPWPMSMRWPLSIWRAAFAPKPQPLVAASNADRVVARGAYLVQGLGHCGACHTPRGVGMQEKTLTDKANAPFLAGGAPIDGWTATSLRGEPRTGLGKWSEADIVQFLQTGRNAHASVFGGMSDVVSHSTQFMTDADLLAVARYLKSLKRLPDDGHAETAYSYDSSTATALRAGDASRPGAQTYLDSCAACHRSDGHGYKGVFPALAGNTAIQGADSTQVVHIILNGGTVTATSKAPSTFTMPPFGWRLSDQEVAELSNFVRNNWGNQAPQVTASDVAKVRKAFPAPAPSLPAGAQLGAAH